MEARLKNLNVWMWRYFENVRNYSGVNFTADGTACEILLDVVNTLRAEGSGAQRTILLKRLDPRDEAKITGGLRFRDYSKLHLKLVDADEALTCMAATTTGEVVDLEFTSRYLDQFEKGLRDVLRGRGDYAIGPPDESRARKQIGTKDKLSEDLWFWPCFGHLYPVR